MGYNTDIIKSYLDKYPNMANLTLSKLIYSENKLLFKDVESIRERVRYFKGSLGKKKLKELGNDKYLSQEKLQEKYNLPVSIETEYKPYKIVGDRGLFIMDLHIPFHNISAISTVFDYTINKDIDFIVLLGDIMDCYQISRFCIDPTRDDLIQEREKTKEFLRELKRLYPKAKIYYKFGNHEKRFEDFLKTKAPELFGFQEFRLEVLLDLFNLGIEYIPENIYIDMGYLTLIHGHEFKNAITSPANPARTTFLRSKSICLTGHYHQSSEHTESKINGDVITCWSVGCLCELHPAYMPLNKWNHGFAIYDRGDDGFWTIQNKRIIQGKVV